MKVLIAYDGSESADAAIMDLLRAGLPPAGVATILSAAETSPWVATAPYAAMMDRPARWPAVRAIAVRNWPRGTEVRVIGVLEPPPGAAAHPGEESSRRPGELVFNAAEDLAHAGLIAVPVVLNGPPADVLLAEAESWAADCLFAGARGRYHMDRFFLGGVCVAVATGCVTVYAAMPFAGHPNQ